MPASSQTTLYVDAVHGDDGNSGQSRVAPLKTLTRAITVANGEQVEMYVAPGVYDAALGERFPLELPPGLYLQSERGVVIDGGGEPLAVRLLTSSASLPSTIGGALIRDARVGIEHVSTASSGALVIHSCAFEECGVGVELSVPSGAPPINADLYSVEMSRCHVGVSVDGHVDLRCVDARFDEMAFAAVEAQDALRVTLHGSQIARSSAGVVLVADREASRLVMSRVAITGCDEAIRMVQVGALVPDISARYLTLAGNGAALSTAGVALSPHVGGANTIERSIITRNRLDVLGPAAIRVIDSIASSTSFFGLAIVDIDPEFVDPDGGDYSLRKGSRAIDAFPEHQSILIVDGDYDGLQRADYGALEYQTMRQPEEAVVGGEARFVVQGDGPGIGLALFSPTRAAVARQLPYGGLFIGSAGAQRLKTFALDSAGRGEWALPVAYDPVLLGESWTVQALVPAPDAPLGRALTAALGVAVER